MEEVGGTGGGCVGGGGSGLNSAAASNNAATVERCNLVLALLPCCSGAHIYTGKSYLIRLGQAASAVGWRLRRSQFFGIPASFTQQQHRGQECSAELTETAAVKFLFVNAFW